MPISSSFVHFKHCRVVCSDTNVFISFKGQRYSLLFSSEGFDAGKGAVVTNLSGGAVESDVLLWLSVYFGEDFIGPDQKQDTRHSNNRGAFNLEVKNLTRFLKAAEKAPSKSYPLWKKRLFESSLIYYSVGVRSGVEMMPLTMGFFGMSLECIGNLIYGKRDDYFTLGTFKFNGLIKTRFKRYKVNPNHSTGIKKWQKFINEDTALIHSLRNAFYGHSFLHLDKGRKDVTGELRKWFVRTGYTNKTAAWCFKTKSVEDSIQTYAPALYKVGLRSSRLLIFMLLGFVTSIPFAEYDYFAVTPIKYDEVMKFNGISITVRRGENEAAGASGELAV